MVNGATLIAISVYVVVEAVQRFSEPAKVQGGLMMAIAAGGLLVNLAGLWILNAGRSENLNVQGAWLHVLTDALGSVGAMAAGGLNRGNRLGMGRSRRVHPDQRPGSVPVLDAAQRRPWPS